VKTPGNTNFVLNKIVPTVPTDEHLTDLWIRSVRITNPSNSTITVTVQDRSIPTPIQLVPGEPLAPGDWFSVESRNGDPFAGGFTWFASATGLHGKVTGLIL